jgi:hypothetical protein
LYPTAIALLLATLSNGIAAYGYKVSEYYPPLTIPPRPDRVVQFPKDFSLGELKILPNGGDDNDPDAKFVSGAARGPVKVPAGKIVVVNAGHHFFRTPALLDSVAPDAIDVWKMSSVSLDDSEDGMSDLAIKHIARLKGLSELNVNRSDATDAGLVHAAELPNLIRISACYTLITGSCLKQIATLKKLRQLRLSGINLNHDNLPYLTTIHNLQYLTISRTGLTNEGVKQIAKCTELIGLDLSQNPNVDDRAIKELLALKKLQYLAIYDCKITPSALTQLKVLPLKSILLPAPLYQKNVMDELRKAFPRAELGMRRSGGVDRDTKELYAPMH